MKRDTRLRRLSEEHHHALVLARGITAGSIDVTAAEQAFTNVLAPHFLLEEEVLLPALESGEPRLCARTRAEHRELEAWLDRARSGDPGALAAFAGTLVGHVRFEERELFPAAERLAGPALDEVERRSRSSPCAPTDGD